MHTKYQILNTRYQLGFLPIWLLVIIVAAIAVGGGTVAIKVKQRAAVQSVSVTPTASPEEVAQTPTHLPAATVLPTSDTTAWGVYRSSEYGFGVKYPKNVQAGTLASYLLSGQMPAHAKGIYIGTGIFVPITTPELRSLFESRRALLANSQPVDSGVGMPSGGCSSYAIQGLSVSIQKFYCRTDGGPTVTYYISDGERELFVENDVTARHDLMPQEQIRILESILSTFEFIVPATSLAHTPSPTTVPSATPKLSVSPSSAASVSPTPSPAATPFITPVPAVTSTPSPTPTPTPSPTPTPAPSPTPTPIPENVVLIRFTNDWLFAPSDIHVLQGATVQFRNDATNRDVWIAANTDTPLAGFNSGVALKQGESFYFTFNTLGNFGYHNELQQGIGATIRVVTSY